ncbi:hypothetical protein Airi01_043130 [Actinoallomurus iriomotensis]|uniref:Uncharacterized protein n=1 Tax=Actinoallomurus iriomotensis TaxID=478107 RepID=A0A9W6RHD3_9ACTN|nr:hypothetical protein Airi01_043130 [Actinoallomurus iriomotensis]
MFCSRVDPVDDTYRGKCDTIHQAYRDGMEDHFGALVIRTPPDALR